MKQKRKVKSLISQRKDWRESLFTALLLILSVILCIGSASLMTMSVWASWEDLYFTYTGLDEKSEVLYDMRFVDQTNLSNTINTMYMEGKALYIVPKPVIVNPATIDGGYIDHNVNYVEMGIYGHVLGGENNKVYSDNVTLIAGENNIVTGGNDNATILGGVSNNSFGKVVNGGTPMLVVGGSNNSIGENHNGVALIGGNGNSLGDNVKNAFVLGGQSNRIGTDRMNVIVGGKNVNVSSVDNVFVYSSKDSEFTPKTNNAFYLNVENGVGMNREPSSSLAVKGAISLGDININSKQCNLGNRGVKGSYQGCIVGCTIKGSDTGAIQNFGKWEMLDRGEKCKEICRDIPGRCFYEEDDVTLHTIPDYEAFCTNDYDDNDHRGRVSPCFSLKNYKNVVFQSSLVDYGKCPNSEENRCVFSCKEGYHLTGNKAGNSSNTVNCYKDCELPWDKTKTIKHNEEIIGYDILDVWCAYSDEDSHSPKSKYTCAGHSKKMVCKDGYLFESNNGRAKGTPEDVVKYKYEYCGLNEYKCDTGKYNLSFYDVKNGKSGKYPESNISRLQGQLDRETKSLKRGVYKLCLDYTPTPPPSPVKNGDNCSTGTANYQLVSCNVGYSTGESHPYECVENCSFAGKTYKDGESVTGYKDNNPVCPNVCESVKLTCKDGVWIGGDVGDYKYNSCTLRPETCNGYNVTQATYDLYNHISGTKEKSSIYEECQKISVSDQVECVNDDKAYKLVDCVAGYHAEGDHCEINYKLQDCGFYYNRPANSHWSRPSGTVYVEGFGNISLESGKFLKVWKCGWTGDSSCWESPIPGGACDWNCNTDDNYYLTGSGNSEYCALDGLCIEDKGPYACGEWDGEHGNNINEKEDDYGFYWDCAGDRGNVDHCHICKDGSSWDDEFNGGTCVKNEDGKCINEGTTPYLCGPLDRRPDGLVINKYTGKFDYMYSWRCQGAGTGATAICDNVNDQSCNCHKCFIHFEYSETKKQCVPAKQIAACSLPENAEWVRGEGRYEQTWTPTSTTQPGSGSWQPQYSAIHNPGGTGVCDFVCKYEGEKNEWSGGKCKGMSRKVQCTIEPDFPFEWVGSEEFGTVAGFYTQRWNNEPYNQWLPSWRRWVYDPTGEHECAIKCPDNYEWSSSESRCIPTVYGECGVSIESPCDEGEYELKDVQILDIGNKQTIVVGWVWNCMGSPEGSNSVDCHDCNEALGYIEDGKTCIKKNDCNFCAVNGFPYCFPVDFGADCKENYYFNYFLFL